MRDHIYLLFASMFRRTVRRAFAGMLAGLPFAVLASVPGWDLATGVFAEDAVGQDDFLSVVIELDTLSVSSRSPRLSIGSRQNGVTPVLLDGQVVMHVHDASGAPVIDASFPPGLRPGIVLTGSLSHGITLSSRTDFRLVLDGLHIASSDGPALNIQSERRAFVQLNGRNQLSDSPTWTARTGPDGKPMDMKATLFSEGPLVITGNGSLDIVASTRHALASDAHIRLSGGSLSIRADKRDGIRTHNAFVMDGGTLRIDATAGKGIKVDGKEHATTPLGFIAINAGVLAITSHDKAITASWESAEDGKTPELSDDPDPRVTINGGQLSITTTGTPMASAEGSLSPEGIEAKSVLTVNGGDITVRTADDGLNAGRHVAINGGRIFVRSTANDAVDSNGTLSISGGLLVAHGAGRREGGLDCDANTFAVTGGTFIGLGGRNSRVTPSATTQNTLVLGALDAGLLVIADEAGRVAFAYELPEAVGAVVLGSPELKRDAYVILRGGSLAGQGERFHGLYVGARGHRAGTDVARFRIDSSVTHASW